MSTDSTRAWKQRRRAELVTGTNGRPYAPNAFRHGTRATYGDWGCRCDPCSDATRRVKAAQRARDKEVTA